MCLPELTDTRAWRLSSGGAIGVAGHSLCSPLTICSNRPDRSSPYRSRSLRSRMAAAVALSRVRMEAFRDTWGYAEAQ